MADLDKTIMKINEEIDAVSNDAAATFEISAEDTSKLLVLIDNTAGGDVLTVTFKAGNGVNSGQGDLAVEVANAGKSFVNLEGERFKNADGEIDCTASIGVGGTLSNAKIYVVKNLY